jgi:hypothetical protein
VISQATTTPAPVPPADCPPETRAAVAGLAVLASAAWPESAADDAPPALAGFIVSSFSPIAAEAARRCLGRRVPLPPAEATAVIVASALGDVTSAVHVASAVDSGARVWPLMFYQSVPNAVAGRVAATAHLTGPVVCVGDIESALEVAALLIEDGDADEALVVEVVLAGADGPADRARAVLVAAGLRDGEGASP